MTHSLQDKVALVTGAASGLGRTIMRHFAEGGARGVSFDVSGCDASDLPSGWSSTQGSVCSEADLARVVDLVSNEYGRLDVVVANAGVVPPWRETVDIDLAEWDDVFATNVRGVVATIKHAVPLMKRQGGSIVVMGSLNSRRAHPRQCLYTATKHAVLGIVRATALDLGRYGIRVNALAPGPIATEALLERAAARAAEGAPPVEAALSQFARETALGSIATEDDVARAATYLAGEDTRGITGVILPVDGGLP